MMIMLNKTMKFSALTNNLSNVNKAEQHRKSSLSLTATAPRHLAAKTATRVNLPELESLLGPRLRSKSRSKIELLYWSIEEVKKAIFDARNAYFFYPICHRTKNISTFHIWQMNWVFSCGPPMVKAILWIIKYVLYYRIQINMQQCSKESCRK